MNWDQIYDYMFFSTETDEFARSRKIQDALTEIYDYSQGNTANDDLIAALDYLCDQFKGKLNSHRKQIESIIDEDDYEAKYAYVAAKLQNIVIEISRNGGQKYLKNIWWLQL